MKFKVGDKIKCIKEDWGLTLGETYILEQDHLGLFVITKEQPRGRYIFNSLDLFELVESTPNFMVGDVVEAFGVRGGVLEINNSRNFPIRVLFENQEICYFFTQDGKDKLWHKTPSLKLIERPVKEVKFETIIKCSFDNGVRIEHSDLSKLPHGKKVEVTVKIKE